MKARIAKFQPRKADFHARVDEMAFGWGKTAHEPAQQRAGSWVRRHTRQHAGGCGDGSRAGFPMTGGFCGHSDDRHILTVAGSRAGGRQSDCEDGGFLAGVFVQQKHIWLPLCRWVRSRQTIRRNDQPVKTRGTHFADVAFTTYNCALRDSDRPDAGVRARSWRIDGKRRLRRREKMWEWLIKYQPGSISAVAGCVTAVCFVVSIIVAVIQIIKANRTSTESTARTIFNNYLAHAFNNPIFAYPSSYKCKFDLEHRKVDGTLDGFERYEWFVSIVVFSMREILDFLSHDEYWETTAKAQLSYHIDYFVWRRQQKIEADFARLAGSKVNVIIDRLIATRQPPTSPPSPSP
jgi:hypothetical protein